VADLFTYTAPLYLIAKELTTMESIKKRLYKRSISEENKKVILDFIQKRRQESISIRRLDKYENILSIFANYVKINLLKVTEKELRAFVDWLENKSNFKEWTKFSYKVVIKTFYRYYNDGELPKMCKFIKMNRNKVEKKLPEDIWTEEEIDKLINSTRDPFWKAFISLGYESGARIGELLNLRIKDVKFTDFGARIRLDGKTGTREIPVLKCIPYLSTYLKLHPYRDNLDAYLWVRSNGKKIGYQGIRFQLRKLTKRCNIKKKCNPHIFRHSRATELANHLTESQLKQYFGWVQSSEMASTYIHLSGRDIDNAVLGMYGFVKKKEEEIKNGLPIKCVRCGFPNEHNAQFCSNCGLPLNIRSAIENVKLAEEGDNLIATILKKLVENETTKKVIFDIIIQELKKNPELKNLEKLAE